VLGTSFDHTNQQIKNLCKKVRSMESKKEQKKIINEYEFF